MVNKVSTRTLTLVLLLATSLCATFYTAVSQAKGLETADRVKPSNTGEQAASPTNETLSFEVAPDAQRPARLLIEGAIMHNDGEPVYVDMATLKNMPSHSISTSTVVTDGVLKFDGVLMRSVLDHVGAYGTTITARALNGYVVDIPIQDFKDFDVLLAWRANGARLKSDDKGPFWIVYPRDDHDVLQDIRYDYRWVWQLISLQVS